MSAVCTEELRTLKAVGVMTMAAPSSLSRRIPVMEGRRSGPSRPFRAADHLRCEAEVAAGRLLLIKVALARGEIEIAMVSTASQNGLNVSVRLTARPGDPGSACESVDLV
jgi:hypothetical protein